ncbi:dienelactone hydrolase family protein [Amycolatopsis sp. GM8]|uniref:dienelactone hydrolase family protein n=1 Tax=Amycolatopsis sp. GM8 TaxID=2896530 RepID=UPI001F20502B|nr:dienelactone hydrolase family protein [Amycolatopsis sp. GM8]
MTQRTVEIVTDDGVCDASLHIPPGSGPWPAVLMYPDAAGLRDVLRDMGSRLSALGYAVLVPNVYYRLGPFEPIDLSAIADNPSEWARVSKMAVSLDVEMTTRDARAFVAYLRGLPETTATVATTGYCLGGRLALTIAGRLGDEISAAASFHGGNLGADGDPTSPHLVAGGITAPVYLACATDDASFPDDQQARLREAFAQAGVTYTWETYPAGHGFAVTDNPTFDLAASERHWDTLASFLASALPAR